MPIFGKKIKGSSKKKQQGNNDGNAVQSMQNRQPIGNRAMAGRKKGSKQLNAVAAGKYDTNFAGLDNEVKLAKLHELALYLESKEALKELTEEDMDLQATYDSVLQQATEDDKFLELLKKKTHDSSEDFKDFKYTSMDAFNKADEKEHGIYQTHEELEASNRRGWHNIIQNIGYSKKGDDLNGYLMMMKRAGDLVSNDLRGQKFREETAINKGVSVDFDNEHDNFITDVSSGKGALSAARNHPTYSTDDEIKEFVAQHRRERADNYKLPQGEGHLANLAKALRESKKGGFGANSERFEQVDQKLEAVINQFNKELDKNDTMKTQETLLNVLKNYKELEEVCEIYINRKVRTTNGQNRQAIVAQILVHVIEDIKCIRSCLDYFALMPKEERFQNISELIEKGRQRKLVVKEGKTEKDLNHVGGAASSLAVIKKGDLTDESVSGYFKEDDIFVKQEKKAIVKDTFEKLKKKLSLSKELSDKIERMIEEARIAKNEDSLNLIDSVFKKDNLYLENREYHEFIDVLYKSCEAKKTVEEGVRDLKINLEDKESVNMSKRNVAASRLANILGVGDLIAQSETVELQDVDGSKRGNLMQAAKGIEGNKAAADIQREEYRKKFKEGEYTASNITGVNLSDIDDRVTPQFMKSLTSLQVLDNLMGQFDRHNANYMVETSKGKLGHVQGIDNDFSFGHTADYALTTNKRNGRAILKKEKETEIIKLSIPYMDKELANNILALKKSEIKLIMQDVLEKKAIDALCERLEIIQAAIQTALDESPERFLEKDGWEKEGVLKEFQNKSTGRTYISDFLDNAKTDWASSESTAQNFLRKESVKEIVQAYWEEKQKEFTDTEGGQSKQEQEFLKECDLNLGELQYLTYLWNTKQLDGTFEPIAVFIENIFKNKAREWQIQKDKQEKI